MDKTGYTTQREHHAKWTEADMRKADTSIQHDVHVLILDYLLHDTTSALLRLHVRRLNTSSFSPAKSDDKGALVNQIHMIDAFLDIYKTSSTSPTAGATSFRLMLLRFLTLYSLRFPGNPLTSLAPHPSALTALRQKNRTRAERWRHTIGKGSFDKTLLQHLRMKMQDDEQEAESSCKHYFSGSTSLISESDEKASPIQLLDLIPCCVELTAARARLAGFLESTTVYTNDVEQEFMEDAGLSGSLGKKRKRRSTSQIPKPEHRSQPNFVDVHRSVQTLNADKTNDTKTKPSWGTSARGLNMLLSLMQHASLEAVPHRYMLEQTLEAFSWGPGPWLNQRTIRGGADSSNFTDDSVRIHNIFHLGTDLPDVDNGIWSKTDFGNLDYARTYRELRQQYLLDTLECLCKGHKGEKAFTELMRDAPPEKLDEEMVEYLSGLHESIGIPVLMQLEQLHEANNEKGIIIDGIQLDKDEVNKLRALMTSHDT